MYDLCTTFIRAFPESTTTLYTSRPIATTPIASGTRLQSAIPPPRHPVSTLLPSRAARRTSYKIMMGRTGKTRLAVETRPPVVDSSPLRQQRPLHLLPSRDRLTTMRQCDISSYGLGAVVHEQVEAQGFHTWINIIISREKS
jgi:hypothetical protein